jgi:hypothetical protein
VHDAAARVDRDRGKSQCLQQSLVAVPVVRSWCRRRRHAVILSVAGASGHDPHGGGTSYFARNARRVHPRLRRPS